jgi:rod shape-determining protein MreD
MAMQASVAPLIEPEVLRIRPWVAIAAAIGALLLQAYLPLFSGYTSMVDLPLLVTVYLAFLRRSPVAGLLIGLAIGLGQDSLSNGPIGMYGITKTIIGYLRSSLTSLVAVDPLGSRVVLSAGFYLFHQAFFWALQQVLLGGSGFFAWQRTLLLAAVNGLAALLLYRFLDRFREHT